MRLQLRILRSITTVSAIACVTLIAGQFSAAADDAKQIGAVRERGVNFLRTTQADDGSWTSPMAPGVSGLITASLIQSGLPADDSTVAKALKHLESHVKSDGGIYGEGSNHKNYETCIAMMAFQAVNADGRYDQLLKNAEKFLRGLQWDEGEGLETSDAAYGGAGYGSHQRPDLSNTSFFLDALKQAGIKSDDPAFQKALVFVSRTQNLESQYNTLAFAAKIDDGGFYYTPAAGGTSQAGTDENGGLRSYGSMTYAGLKSMIYAGVEKDDKRVQAALNWLRKHYSITENPGMGQNGLFYYYHTFAKALDALGEETFADEAGTKHNWRQELAAQLTSLQKSNGSWVNETPRWMEGDPNLATGYALLALKYCDAKADAAK